MRWRSVLGAALPLALVLGGPAAAGCLSYGGPVQLDGTLTFREFPGPPNFDDKSQPMTLWFLELAAPMCVDADPANRAINMAAKDLTEIQIVAAYPPGYTAFRLFRGKEVHLTGTLHGQAATQHKTAVFLGDARLDQPGK